MDGRERSHLPVSEGDVGSSHLLVACDPRLPGFILAPRWTRTQYVATDGFVRALAPISQLIVPR